MIGNSVKRKTTQYKHKEREWLERSDVRGEWRKSMKKIPP